MYRTLLKKILWTIIFSLTPSPSPPRLIKDKKINTDRSNLKEKIVGILHDVVEDTEWTCEDLKKEGFPDEIIEAVRCVTKLSDEEDYEEYIGRCATNPLAIAVKIHDLTDNMDVRRMPCIGEKEISRLKKYLKAYHRLMPFYMNH